jgi:acyl-[acyl-carrier-protein]-phospholipid O-acyltransferase/long-chain-fatty-acid--[acyl-carrier-protein] ligase
VFVVGVPDATKGEALVMLTTREVTPEMLRTRLGELGVPNLWVPKIIKRVEKIPMLGTGKTDLKRCKEVALETAA